MGDRLYGILERIAIALETIARGSEPEEPDLRRPIADFSNFDWSSIGADIAQQDNGGPTHVTYGGFLWTRRSPINKFEPAIWFSRSAGKDVEGNVKYLRLITFQKIGDADPLPKKAAELLKNTKPGERQPGSPQKTEPPTDLSKDAAGAAGAAVGKSRGQSKPAPPSTSAKPPSRPNGQRPYTPEQLRNRLGEIQATHNGKTASDKQRSLVAMLLDTCFAGESDATDKRHAVQLYLFGVASLKDTFDTSILAALDWLKPVQDSGGDYKPDSMAIREAQAIFRQSLKDEGQTEMF